MTFSVILYVLANFSRNLIAYIIINLTPFEPKAMRVSYEKSRTKENLTTFVVG